MSTKEQATVDAFNRDNPIGTEVIYWAVPYALVRPEQRYMKQTRTRTKAYVSNSGCPMILIEGIVGSVYLDHVEVVREKVRNSEHPHAAY